MSGAVDAHRVSSVAVKACDAHDASAAIDAIDDDGCVVGCLDDQHTLTSDALTLVGQDFAGARCRGIAFGCLRLIAQGLHRGGCPPNAGVGSGSVVRHVLGGA